MVDLTSSTGGQYYGFSNTIFIFAGILVISVVENIMEFEALKEGLRAGKEQEALLNELNNDDIPVNEIDMEKLQKLMEGFTNQVNANAGPVGGAGIGMGIHWGIYVAAFVFLFSLIGFFGYKLVQSLKEKERKKEEKKRLKELKKKK